MAGMLSRLTVPSEPGPTITATNPGSSPTLSNSPTVFDRDSRPVRASGGNMRGTFAAATGAVSPGAVLSGAGLAAASASPAATGAEHIRELTTSAAAKNGRRHRDRGVPHPRYPRQQQPHRYLHLPT